MPKKCQKSVQTSELWEKCVEIDELKKKLSKCKCMPKEKPILTEEEKAEQERKKVEQEKKKEEKKQEVEKLKQEIETLKNMLKSKLLV